MGLFQGSPTSVAASFLVLPKGNYEFTIGEPKAFERTTKNNAQQYGIMWPLTVQTDGEFKGKTLYFNGNEDNDFGKAQNKRILMAADGLEINDANEAEWNAMHGADDFTANSETKLVGQGWLAAKGKRIIADVDINFGKKADGSEDQSVKFQKWVSFSPVKG